MWLRLLSAPTPRCWARRRWRSRRCCSTPRHTWRLVRRSRRWRAPRGGNRGMATMEMKGLDKDVAYCEAPSLGTSHQFGGGPSMLMRRMAAGIAVAAIVLAGCTQGGASPAATDGAPGGDGECFVGVSWNNFQQPRWAATDKPNLQETIEAGGGTYTDADANLDTEQQLTDVESMIGQGINVLVLLAQDTTVVGPALEAAAEAGIPVIAYDRLIEDPSVLYITFDNVGVGRAEAEALFEVVPEGTYVLIKGDPGDPNASTFLPQGWDEAALQLCEGTAMGEITLPDDLIDPSVAPAAGLTASDFTTPGPDGEPDSGDENTVKAFILQPTPITAENLELVIEGGWITQEELCEGVEA